MIVGSETFCSDAYRFYELAKHEPRLLGDFVWAGMDYLGEVGIGAWEYPDYVPDFSHGPGWIAAGAGRIDLIGRTQGEALYTRVALEREKGPLLAVWPVNHTKEKSTPLPRGACPTPSLAGAGTVVKENLPWWKSMPAPPKWR